MSNKHRKLKLRGARVGSRVYEINIMPRVNDENDIRQIEMNGVTLDVTETAWQKFIDWYENSTQREYEHTSKFYVMGGTKEPVELRNELNAFCEMNLPGDVRGVVKSILAVINACEVHFGEVYPLLRMREKDVHVDASLNAHDILNRPRS